MIPSRSAPRRQIGATYIEVLIASVLIVVSLVPMTNALRGAVDNADAFEAAAVEQLQMTAMLESLLAEPFSSLGAAATEAGSKDVVSSYSDDLGTTPRRLVYLSLYDGDNADSDDDPFTGGDDGLMWIRVEVEGTQLSIESLVSQ